MPTYQYACTTCDHRFEAVQAFSDASLTECPACTGTLRKVFSSVGIVFKGSGFYRTDSRAGAGSTVSTSDAGGSDKGGSSEKSGSEKSGSAEKSTSPKKESSSTPASTSSAPAAAAKS